MKRVSYDDLDVEDDCAISLDGEPFTGIAYEAYPNGNALNEQTYVNGSASGPARVFYMNGQIKSEAQYWSGSLHGLYREFDRSGKVCRERLFELGVLTSELRWGENGALLARWDLKDGDDMAHHLLLLRSAYGRGAPPVIGDAERTGANDDNDSQD